MSDRFNTYRYTAGEIYDCLEDAASCSMAQHLMLFVAGLLARAIADMNVDLKSLFWHAEILVISSLAAGVLGLVWQGIGLTAPFENPSPSLIPTKLGALIGLLTHLSLSGTLISIALGTYLLTMP